MPAIELTAGLGDVSDLLGGLGFGLLNAGSFGDPTNPIEVYPALLTNSFENVMKIGGTWLDRPFPIAQAVAANQIHYLTEAFEHPESILGVPGAMFSNAQSVFGDLTTIAPKLTIDSPLLDNVGALVAAIKTILGINIFNPEAWAALSDALQNFQGSDVLDVFVKLPPAMVMGLASIGPLVNAMAAFDVSSDAFGDALNAGDLSGFLTAFGTLIAAPGFVGDGMLNGQWGLDLLGHDLPLLNGLLVPQTSFDFSVGDLSIIGLGNILNLEVGPFSGLADGFVNYLPAVVADALGGHSLFGADNVLGELPLLGSLFDVGNFADLSEILSGLGVAGLGAGLPLELLNGFDPMMLLGLLPF
ncbi:hypothetical protein AWC30_11910 [Mycolicibacillus trivialis]|uniref:PE-PGRS family protein n=2 Tax=Mycolicibacillus trivialis TaxID=1798 RepID=A0A1X2EIZ1_9MYCO|nr:hypothetical protein AWC30_11910 [Mycolicibacillus trivialis]